MSSPECGSADHHQTSGTGQADEKNASVEASFCGYLSRLETNQSRGWHLFVPLAYAEGAGLPISIWVAFASSLSGQPFSDGDVEWLRNHHGGFVVETNVDGRSVYGLSAPELATYIRSRQDRPQRVIQSIICDLLFRMAPSFHGTVHKDWSSAEPYVRRHIVDHAVAIGSLDVLANDLRYLAVADPPHIIRATREPRATHPSLVVYRLCSHHLRYGSYENNLSYFQLAAYRNGEITLGKAVDLLPARRLWSACWAQWRFEPPHHVVGRHGREGDSTLYKTDKLSMGAHSIDTLNLDGRDIVVSCGYDKQIRFWDLEKASAFGEPISIRSSPMQLAVCRHSDTIFLVVFTAFGAILAWKWLGSFQPLGTIGSVSSADAASGMTAVSTEESTFIAACGTFLELFRWNATGCIKLPFKLSAAPVALACGKTADPDILIAAGYPHSMALFSGDGTELWRKETPVNNLSHDRVTAVETHFLGDRFVIFGTERGRIEIRECGTGQLVKEVVGAHRGAVSCLAIAHQEQSSIMLSGGRDAVIRLWKLPDLTPTGGILRGHNAGLTALKVCQIKGAPSIISASEDATIRAWDFPGQSQRSALSMSSESVFAVALGDLDGRETVLSLTGSGAIKLCTSDTGSPLKSYFFTLPFDRRNPPVNGMALGLYSGDQRAAVALGGSEILVWHPITGQAIRSREPAPPIGRKKLNGDRNTWCVCLGTVKNRLARVAHYDRRHRMSFVEVFDLETGQSLSVAIEAYGPLNTLRLGEFKGEAVIVSRSHHGHLFVARLTDGLVIGEPIDVLDPAEICEFTYPVAVGAFYDKPVVVLAQLGRTDVSIVSVATRTQRLSIDLDTEINGVAIGSNGIVIGTTKGLLKVRVAPEAL